LIVLVSRKENRAQQHNVCVYNADTIRPC